MNCPNCGSYYEGTPSYCPNCGAPLQQQNYQQQNYQQNNYGYQQPYNQPPAGGFSAPIPHRNIALCVVLSIVTCGIYGIYWFICLANDLNQASGEYEDTSGGMVFLLSLITCGIYELYWMYKAGNKVDKIKRRSGMYADSNTGILYLILAVLSFGIVSYCLIQSELNNVAAN